MIFIAHKCTGAQSLMDMWDSCLRLLTNLANFEYTNNFTLPNSVLCVTAFPLPFIPCLDTHVRNIKLCVLIESEFTYGLIYLLMEVHHVRDVLTDEHDKCSLY